MRILACFVITLALGMAAWAQDRPQEQETPHWEAFLGYSNLQTDVTGSRLMLHGGQFSLTENVNSWFGGLLNISGQVGHENGDLVDTEAFTYGPQFTWRQFQSVTPSVHVGMGIVRTSAGFLGTSNARINLAVEAGGALDIPLTQNLAFRVLQADWIGTRFGDPSIRHNVRFSTGIQFHFFGYDPQ